MDGIADRGGIVSGISWGSDHFPGDQGAAEQSGADDMCRSFVYWSGVVYAGAAISSVWKMSRGGEKSQEDDLQIVEKEDSMETSQETRREIPDIQFKQEMPEQEEKEEKEAPIDTEEQSDSQ